MRNAIVKYGLASVLFATLAGCGDGLDLTGVTGTVSLDGKPVPNAVVTFVPQGGTGSPSNGVTDAEGRYTLMFSRDREGAFVGTHDVTVETEQVSIEEQSEMADEGIAPGEFVKLPAKYASKGELVKEVKPGDNTIDLDLKSE
jgi:hypothetical protein